MKYIYLIILLVLITLPILNAKVLYDNPKLPRVAEEVLSGGNVSWNQSLTDSLYLLLSGSNANQNIDIGIYNYRGGSFIALDGGSFTARDLTGNWGGRVNSQGINFGTNMNPSLYYNLNVFETNNVSYWHSTKQSFQISEDEILNIDSSGIDINGYCQADNLITKDDIINFTKSGTAFEVSETDGDGRFHFDGDNDYMQTSESDFLDAKSTGSFSAWFRAYDDGATYGVFGIYTDDSYDTSSLAFRLNPGGNLTKVWNPSGGNGWASLVTPSPVVTDSLWHHIVFTPTEIWFDGVNQTGLVYTSYTGSAIDDWFSDIYDVGTKTHRFASGRFVRGSPIYTFNGTIDEIMLFDDVLNTTEIDYLNDSGRNNTGVYSGTGDIINQWKASVNSGEDSIGGETFTLVDGTDIIVENNDTVLNTPPYMKPEIGYMSSDGTIGYTGTCASSDTLTIKDGLIVGCS